jgi:hypothetical protein
MCGTRSADILVYQYLSESIHFATICCADAKRLFSRIPAFSFGCGLAALRCIADILVGRCWPPKENSHHVAGLKSCPPSAVAATEHGRYNPESESGRCAQQECLRYVGRVMDLKPLPHARERR